VGVSPGRRSLVFLDAVQTAPPSGRKGAYAHLFAVSGAQALAPKGAPSLEGARPRLRPFRYGGGRIGRALSRHGERAASRPSRRPRA
jgi:hypothetical protein